MGKLENLSKDNIIVLQADYAETRQFFIMCLIIRYKDGKSLASDWKLTSRLNYIGNIWFLMHEPKTPKLHFVVLSMFFS